MTMCAFQHLVRFLLFLECIQPLNGVIGGTARIPLNNPKVIGVANFRGNRRCVIHYLKLFNALTFRAKQLSRGLLRFRRALA